MSSKALRVFGLLTVGLVFASCPGLGKINFEFDQTGPMLSEEQDDLIPGASQYSIRFDEAIKLSGTPGTLTASLKYPTPITDEPQEIQWDITVPRSNVSIGEDSTRLVITIPDDASLQENMEITFTIPAGYLTDEVDNLNEEIKHTVTVSLGAAGIGSFEFLASENTNYLTMDVVATITAGNNITAIVPYGTNRNGLIATFTASDGATVTVDSNDFSNAVIYTVTAADGTTTRDYTVTVTITPYVMSLDTTSFSYTAVEATEGTASDNGVPPVWNNGHPLPSSITYSITNYRGAGSKDSAVEIDSVSGVITITADAVTVNSGTYTVTAEASPNSNYEAGTTKTADVTVTITPKANLNTTSFSYTYDVDTVEGSPTTGDTPAWDQGNPNPLDITYSITDYNGAGSKDSAVQIDPDTGLITITADAKAANSGEYTVTATAGSNSNYKDSTTKTATVTVTINSPPGAPTGVTVNQVAATGTSVTVSWTAPDAGTDNGSPATINGYTVYWQTTANVVIDPTTAQSQTLNTPTTNTEITGLTAGTDYTFAVTATNSNSLTSPLSATKQFISTEIISFVFKQQTNGLPSDFKANISGNDITAVVPWGMSSSLPNPTVSTNPSTSVSGSVSGHPSNGDYSNDVTLRLTSTHGNFHYYTVSVLEIGYKEDEVTADAAKGFLTPGDLSHPWLFSIKNLDPEATVAATADIELTLGNNNTYSETLSPQALTVPTTHSDGVTKIYGVSLVNQTIISNAYAYSQLQGLTDKTATVKITIKEAGKEYPIWEESLTTGVENVYSWHDLQSMDSKTYTLACSIHFPPPGKYGFPEYGFTPINTMSAPEQAGELSGNPEKKYVIEDFYINADKRPSSQTFLTNIGMFDTIGMKSKQYTYIKDLTFVNPEIIATNKQYRNVGVLAGEIAGTSTTEKQFIKGVYVTTTDPNHVIIDADATNIGGIVGKIAAPTLALFYVSSSGTITATSASTNVGGLVGYSEGIVVVGYSTADVTGGNYAGGLVGYDKGNTVGFSFGTVSGTTSGGLVGKFENSSPAAYIIGYYAGSPPDLSIAGIAGTGNIQPRHSDFFESNGGFKQDFYGAWGFTNVATITDNPTGFYFGQRAPQTFINNQKALLSP